MKKHPFLILMLTIMIPLITFAQNEGLNENFENFTIGSTINSSLVWTSASSDVTLQIVENPNTTGINTSTKVMKITRAQNTGITIPWNTTYRGATTASYDLSNVNSGTIEAKMLKTVTGKVGIRIYSDAINFKEVISPEIIGSPNWQVVRFDFKGQIVTPITPNAKLIFQPEKNGDPAASQTDALVVYFDDIRLMYVLDENFENFAIGSKSYSSIDWGSTSTEVALQVVSNPNKAGINPSTKALKITRNQNIALTESPCNATYRGATSTSYDLTNVNFSTIELKVLKTTTGKIGLRIYSDATSFKEIISPEITGSPDWQIVQFDFTGQISVPITSNAKIIFQPEKECDPFSSQTDSLKVYIDDIKLGLSDAKFAFMRQNMISNVSLGANYDLSNWQVIYTINYNTSSALNYWNSMSKTPTTSGYLWVDYNRLTGDVGWSGQDIRISLERLLSMVQAYGLVGSTLYHNTTLLADIKTSMSYIYTAAYNEKTVQIGNWWEWKVGIPLILEKIISILFTELPDTIKNGYYSTIRQTIYPNIDYQTYANISSECEVLLYLGALSNNINDIAKGLTYIDKAFIDTTTISGRKKGQAAFVTQWQTQSNGPNYSDLTLKEGLYDDGTFIQHFAIPYIGTYGSVMLQSAANFSSTLNGTGLGLTSALKATLVKWIDGAFLLSLYEGEMMNLFTGRINYVNPHSTGKTILLNTVLAANLVATTDNARIKSVCKRMLTNDSYWNNQYDGLTLPLMPVVKSFLADNTITASANLSFSKVFSAGDRVIHNKPDYRFGISMSSSRIGKFESINGDNPCGWYLGDGMTYMHNSDRNQYVDYFATVDPYRLPGTTVDPVTRTLVSVAGAVGDGNYGFFGVPSNAKDWVGGTNLRDIYSVAGMDLVGEVSSLKAKKSWFMFDNEIVALGAGISLTEARTPMTIIENRSPLGKTNTKTIPNLTIDNVVKSAAKGWSEDLVSPKWACLEGTGGYYFPQNYTVTASRNQNGFTQMLINHGISPTNADYSYVLLPNATTQTTTSYTDSPQIQILSNTKDIQAVKETKLNILGVNFWVAGQIDILNSSNPASVMLQVSKDTIYFSVSDPTWLQTSLTLTINGNYIIGAGTDESIKTVLSGKKTDILVNVTDKMGKTQKAVLISTIPNSLVNEVLTDNNIKCYYSPMNHSLNLNNLPVVPSTVSLINVFGIQCKKFHTNKSNDLFNITGLNSGIYIVFCDSDSGKEYAGKIIIN